MDEVDQLQPCCDLDQQQRSGDVAAQLFWQLQDVVFQRLVSEHSAGFLLQRLSHEQLALRQLAAFVLDVGLLLVEQLVDVLSHV